MNCITASVRATDASMFDLANLGGGSFTHPRGRGDMKGRPVMPKNERSSQPSVRAGPSNPPSTRPSPAPAGRSPRRKRKTSPATRLRAHIARVRNAPGNPARVVCTTPAPGAGPSAPAAPGTPRHPQESTLRTRPPTPTDTDPERRYPCQVEEPLPASRHTKREGAMLVHSSQRVPRRA